MTSTPPVADESGRWLDDIESFLAAFTDSGDVVEVRLPKWNKYGQTASGYFDDAARLKKSVFKFDGRANVYITVNPVVHDLLARSNNRIRESAKHTTSDSDIPQRRWFGIDIDPARPSGISSTDQELAQASQVSQVKESN